MKRSGVQKSNGVLAAGFLLVLVFHQVSAQKRCICMVDNHNCLWNYDLLKFSLPLPCEYRMTNVRTRTGCDVNVNLVMSQGEDGVTTRPKEITYMVRKGSGAASGSLSARGGGVSDPKGFDTMFYPPGLITMNGIQVYSYTDKLGFKSILFPTCAISLHFQENGYVGVYSRNYTDDYAYGETYLCGDCNGGKNEMRMLGSDIRRSMRTWDDRTAAMLLYTSLHIVGGDSQCRNHAKTTTQCPQQTAYRANQVCGCILSPDSQTGKCMRERMKSRDLTNMYYACVEQYCRNGGFSFTGCNMIRDGIQREGCSLPEKFSC